MAVAMPMLGSAEAVAALGAFLRLRCDGATGAPEVAARLDAVIDVLGVRDAVEALDEREAVALLGLVEGFLAQATDFVINPRRTGWSYEEPSILMAQGHTSALLAPVFARFVIPALGGDLAARLRQPGASFLDVGAGVAALSVAMCRSWPLLHVVGLEPWEPARALAREHVAAAGLSDRIDVRSAAVETLTDTEEHDLAWLPTFFISAPVLERALERVHAALRRGGCAIVGLYARPQDPLAAALADLRTARQGGTLLDHEEAIARMAHAGFVDLDALLEVVPRTPVVFVIGRRRNVP